MLAIGLKVLKNRLSEYVRIAEGGETVLITDRDRVVAELTPPSAGRAESIRDAELAEAVRAGWLTPALTGPGGPVPRQPVAKLSDVMRELEADREDR